MVLKALEKGSSKDREALLRVLGHPDVPKEIIESAIHILHDTGAVSYARDLALQKINEGKTYLSKADISRQSFEFFSSLADYMINRNI